MKNITVPVNEDAMSRLDYDNCEPGDLIELFINDDEFNSLWKSGVFEKFNDKFSMHIDDYEDESLMGLDNLLAAKEMLESIKSEDKTFLDLKAMFDKAVECNTGVFFFF